MGAAGRRRLTLRGGVQLEIVANLFVMMFAGLAIVAVVMTGLSLRALRDDALERLRMGARHLERSLDGGARRLGDLAATVRASGPRLSGGEFRVLDERGREPGFAVPGARADERLELLLELAREDGEAVELGSLVGGDLTLVRRLRSPAGETGFLVGRASGDEIWRRLAPVIGSAAWLLFIATIGFVGFGAWLLRRRVVSPLALLAAGTRRIAEGDLRARIAEHGPAELEELARGFNQMAESLELEREALLRAQESLSRSRRLASLGQLAAGVAHEVGNPVAAILGYAEVCRREKTASPRTRELAELIADEALRVRALVREMLDLSRPEALLLERVEPGALVERVASRMRPQPLLAGLELDVQVEPGLPEVEVDWRRIEQVFVNLIENAAHALRAGGGRRIELAARSGHAPSRPSRRSGDAELASYLELRAPDGVAFEVVDDGPGIDPEDLPRIFDPFFTTKGPDEGTGLGLWNAHRIAELLGGRLEVTSQSGRTCFRLVLPAADTPAGDVQAPRTDHR
ncbi:MAG: HAMP domain-containing histidine kinase [Deltaproteobacteria bacterium]|nr:HAMP domain-containing histidine kinase [Deltaproteobacteria bacterium]